jgi:Zn-dependent protease with chaperone function/outer membrane protein assembly factor BamD (BamD/ComL family)
VKLRRSCAFVTLLALVSGALSPLPARAQTSPPTEPNSDLFEKSVRAASEAMRVYGEWDEPEQLRRVAEIGYRIAAESGYRDFPLSFYLMDLAEPNAFALPAGQVFVTRGLITLGLADDELAALLGHEIAHVVHRHGVRMERRATLLNLLTQAALIGAMLGADNDNRNSRGNQLPYPYNLDDTGSSTGDLITGTYAAGVILSELLLRSYSREFEDEADESGQRWAAAAGYSPRGTEKLMAVLGSRLPDSKEYGYWRTHPFFEQRLTAARARGADLRRGEVDPTVDEFRSWSQGQLLDLGAALPKPSPSSSLVEAGALSAWPKGAEAERLRLERLHRAKERTLARVPISRDYGRLIGRYDEELRALEALDPSSGLITTLRDERGELATEAATLLPQARDVWQRGVYETGFLESYLSNWPEAPEAPQVALALGEAYSRTGRQSEAVELFLRAARSDSPAAEPARRGLRNLAASLDELAALAELAVQDQDPTLANAATARLGQVVRSYSDLASGAEYLTRYPDGDYAEQVAARQNLLADNLYGEVILYQGVGDHVKAIERIQQILTFAPGSPAAQKLLEKVVLPG